MVLPPPSPRLRPSSKSDGTSLSIPFRPRQPQPIEGSPSDVNDSVTRSRSPRITLVHAPSKNQNKRNADVHTKLERVRTGRVTNNKVVKIHGSPKQNGWKRTADIDEVLAWFKLSKLDIDTATIHGSPKQNGWKRTADIDKVLADQALAKPKSIAELAAACVRRLDFLDSLRDNPSGLCKLIEDTGKLNIQSWKKLVVFTDYSERDPNNEKLFSSRMWNRYVVVDILVKICESYRKEFVYAEENGFQLNCQAVDDEWGSLVRDIIELGTFADADGIEKIEIVEWERGETVRFLDTTGLCMSGGEDDAEHEVDDDDEIDVLDFE